MTSSARTIGPDAVTRFIQAMFRSSLFRPRCPAQRTRINPMEGAMRQILIASALAAGLIALWAAILPLTAQPAPHQTAVAPEVLSKALFLCRGPNGIDNKCAAALASALAFDNADQQV